VLIWVVRGVSSRKAGMTEFNAIGPLAVLFGAVFTNNILLTNYLGMCSFPRSRASWTRAAGLGAAVVFVMALANALNWPIPYYVLVPLGLSTWVHRLLSSSSRARSRWSRWSSSASPAAL
jgi:hypothetical protein